MCNHYDPPKQEQIEVFWRLAKSIQPSWPESLYPYSQGPFIRAGAQSGRQLVVGQWGLIPHFAKTARSTYPTNNARSEELAEKASYRQPWAKGQRCIIPAVSFDEPCWETGRNVWWRFRRADGAPWGLAGLWNSWLDRSTGALIESYTLLTINADAHPLMRRMHKPRPDRAADRQDKRSVIPIESGYVDAWLHGDPVDAKALLRLAPNAVFDAAPVPPAANG